MRNRIAGAPRGRGWSVRARILSSTLLVAAIGLCLSGGAAYLVQRDRTIGAIDERLESRVELARLVIAGGVTTVAADGSSHTHDFATATSAVHEIIARVLPGSNESALGIVDGTATFIPGVELDYKVEDDAAFVQRVVTELRTGGVKLGTAVTTVGTLRYIATPVSVTGDATRAIYVVTVNLDAELNDLNQVFSTYAVVALFSLLAIALVGWVVSGRLLRPIRELRATASRITATAIDERIPVSGRDDVSALADTVNTMLDRLELAMTSQRQLLDDVRHELMTPITIVRGHLELLDPAQEEEVRATRLLALDELDRMTGLVNDIEYLAETPVIAPDRESVDIAELQAAVFAKALAMGNHEWVLGESATARVWLDRARITQAWLQLIDNAAKYSPAGSRITIGTSLSGDSVQLWVRDRGPGIPAESRARIFERFGRVDAGRGIRGSGLGLPIVAAIARAHDGRVDVESSDSGSRFAIVIPTSADAGGYAQEEHG